MFGSRLARAFEEVKDRFDPQGLYNPGKVVRPPKFDDRSLFRYAPGYHGEEMKTQLDWSAYPGSGNGFQGAIEMCNNNGACRKLAGGAMCPSYRVTRDERDVTRGRANALRLAITGQLGADALTSEEMAETLKLCVSCKACRRECPTGVDMARMKIEVQAARAAERGLSLHERLVAYLPRYAPYASRLPWLLNLRDVVPGAATVSQAVTGFAARRPLPHWRRDVFRDPENTLPRLRGRGGEGASRMLPPDAPGASTSPANGGGDKASEVVLFADTFNRYFERENIEAALAVLAAAGYRVHVATPVDDEPRPLCCGRTFLSVGLIDEARREIERVLAALEPFIARGIPVVGLEPSCLLGFRDEIPALIPGEASRRLASQSFLFEEFLAREAQAGRLQLALRPVGERALLHGHCHQKSFGAMGAVETVLKLVPGLGVETVDSSCCGMAGAFGYGADTVDVSLAMGELSLLPAVRNSAPQTIVIADGTSCRQQIRAGAGRTAVHVARVLAVSAAAARGL
jgi:Fe-S oxidoreductase